MLPRRRGGGDEDGLNGEEEASSIKKAWGEDSAPISSSSSSAKSNYKPPSANGMEVDTNSNNGSGPPEIDEDLHSRQLAVYGRETMRKLFVSNVLVSGINGLSMEIGTVELWDLSSNFYFSEDDDGKNRALACVQKLQELNSAVLISTMTGTLSKEQLDDFQAVVFTDISLEKATNHQFPSSSLKYVIFLAACSVTSVRNSQLQTLMARNHILA